MKLDEIHAEWAQDAKMDKDALDDVSIQIPYLHSKYMRILSEERMAFRGLGEKKRLLTQKLEDYYNGKIDGRDIGREPWQLQETKGFTEKRVENDKDMVDLNIRIFNQEEKVLLLKEIITNLNQRSFQISNAVKFMVFRQGEL